MNTQLNKHGIITLWLVQFSLVLLTSGFCMLKFDIKTAYSTLLGGLIYIIPNVYFASKLFKHQGARSARQIVRGFYTGEAVKIVLSILLFAMVFKFCTIRPAALFESYVLVLMTHWFTPWIIYNKRKRPKSD